MTRGREAWRNWAGNQSCAPATIVKARDVEDVQQAVVDAAERGGHVRVTGAGHSWSALVCSDDVIVDVSSLSGVVDVDGASVNATVWAGTTIKDLGEALWNEGLSLRNQGDINTQTIGGAVSTATHGSGLDFTSFSGALRSVEYVAADGSLRTVDDSTDCFGAFRTALGTLGIFTKLRLDLAPAHQLVERIEYWPLPEVMDRWAEESTAHRHFSYFWGPDASSLELYGLDSAPAGMTDGCYVKMYDEAPCDAVLSEGGAARRLGPAHQIYPGNFDGPYDELEYFVSFDRAAAAVDAVREVIGCFPEQKFPLEVRSIAAEDGWLSPMFNTSSVSLAVSAAPGTDYWPFFDGVDAALRGFGARPHWGKLHRLGRGRLEEVYPRYQDFIELRAQRDPQGLFFNDYTRRLLG